MTEQLSPDQLTLIERITQCRYAPDITQALERERFQGELEVLRIAIVTLAHEVSEISSYIAPVPNKP